MISIQKVEYETITKIKLEVIDIQANKKGIQNRILWDSKVCFPIG